MSVGKGEMKMKTTGTKMRSQFRWLLLASLLATPSFSSAQSAAPKPPEGWAEDPPALSSLVAFAHEESDLRVAIVRYLEDKSAIERRYPVHYSAARLDRLRTFLEGWRRQVDALDFDALNHEGQIDYISLRNRIEYELQMLALAEARSEQIAPLAPFADKIGQLQIDRHDRIRAEPQKLAATYDQLVDQVAGLQETLAADAEKAAGLVRRRGVSRVQAMRAADHIDHLRETLEDFHTFYDGYDPLYNFWAREPYGRLQTTLEQYAQSIREHIVGIEPGEKAPIIGDPVGAAALRANLKAELIPYSPAELIEIAQTEFNWITAQFRIVSNEMGFGDDWKAALEHTKNLAPPPGEKPWIIFEIGDYSEEYIENMDAVTLPPLAREVWRLAMQTPERQLINPFFTGGEQTRVSYPTDGMSHKDKMMSMRGNTPHFNFGTVQHELLPGHHMQSFMSRRFNSHRGALNRTPFWGEGWALYWELLLWDRGDFSRNNPDKIGVLFWRLHRAARIIFSLNYQLGNWSADDAVEFLVEEVGHERANAEAEVRRSALAVPLYQAAYMLGGLQFRALYQELVASGQMTEREFHDSIMVGGRMPVELVRARFTKQPLTPDFESTWRFYESLE